MTLTVAQARELPRGTPVLLVEIALKNSGPTLYFSDRCIDVGAQTYEGYLSDVASLQSGLSRLDSSAGNADIDIGFKNDPIRTYSHLVLLGDDYPFTGAVVTIKELLTDATLGQATAETVFTGVLDEPREINLLGFRCSVSSTENYKDSTWSQPIVNVVDFPAAVDDVGAVLPVVIGGPFIVPTLKTTWGRRTTLKNELLKVTTNYAYLSDVTGLTAPGEVLIDDEVIRYATITASLNRLNTLTRGHLGASYPATRHAQGAAVVQHQDVSGSSALIADHDCVEILAAYVWLNDKLVGLAINGAGNEDAVFANSAGQAFVTFVVLPRVKLAVTERSGGTSTVEWKGAPTNAASFPVTLNDAAIIFSPPASPDAAATNWKVMFDYAVSVSSITGASSWQAYARVGTSNAILSKMNKAATEVIYNIGTPGEFLLASRTQEFRVGCGGDGPGSISITVYNPMFYCDIPSPDYEVIHSGIADRVYVELNGAKDLTGDYGGVGTKIERPDYAIKWWLIERMGYAAGEIDTTSFDAAGTWYAANGYTLGGRTAEKVVPSEVVRRMAFNARSTIDYRLGKWYLNVIPDTAPASAKTIVAADLAAGGSMFTFDRTPRTDIANQITAMHTRNYGPDAGEKPWLGSVTASGAVLGMDPLPVTMELEWCRNAAQAQDVADLELLKRKQQYLIVSFPVFWQHSDVYVGQTIEIENDLWTGKKFFVESVERSDAGRLKVTAVEWWS